MIKITVSEAKLQRPFPIHRNDKMTNSQSRYFTFQGVCVCGGGGGGGGGRGGGGSYKTHDYLPLNREKCYK